MLHNPDNHDMYVANSQDNTVSVIATLPVANACLDQQVQSSQIVHLNGSASYDPSGFTPLTYNWTQTSDPSISLSNSTSANPSFTLPKVNNETVLTFQLVVANSIGMHSKTPLLLQ